MVTMIQKCTTIDKPRAYEVIARHDDGREERVCSVFRGSDATGHWSPPFEMARDLVARAKKDGAEISHLSR